MALVDTLSKFVLLLAKLQQVFHRRAWCCTAASSVLHHDVKPQGAWINGLILRRRIGTLSLQ